MSIVKSDTDKMPDDVIESRAKTYEGLMTFAYVWGLPIVLAIVMFLTLLLRDVGFLTSLIISFFTFLGVMAFSKTFFVH
ncbi:hypothetical protein [Parvularcula lutaonensis]|uniref:Aa3-type cytochrome c oxidase subunit IV n=1 Tax=Parvularcula lutaonensis TaxID=491923 RepID=A0ABV7MBD6_9PROT|nr:hypothetical protein [Parvularcula lutaonensis]GGY38269.1 hypothetical protein GCM10007148_03210 [Parvularcula lutaonensis]